MLTDEEKADIINIMKSVLKKYDIDIDVDNYKHSLEDTLDSTDINPTPLVYFNYCPFSSYFRERIITDLNHSLYAFKRPDFAMEMLENNDLRLTSLKKNEENDPF
ncbi:MAG: hypothetical protein LBH25_01015 [Fibromonadaceae bacterium]|nr:hypothetical protein [Fibromonadaceae bacterium]